MLISTGEDIFTDFNLFLYLSNLYGFTSFSVKKNKTGRKYLIHNKCWHLFSLAFQILTCICGYCTHLGYKFEATNRDLFFILERVMRFASFIALLACCIHKNICVNKSRKLWCLLHEAEKDLRIWKISANHRLLRFIATTCVLFVTTMVTFSVISIKRYLWSEDVRITTAFLMSTSIYFVYRYGVLCMLMCQHVSLCSILREIFVKLRDAARRKFVLSRFAGPKDLLEIARCHQQFCEVARYANSILSFQLLAELLHVFCLTVICAFGYAVFVTNIYARYQHVTVLAVWALFCAFYIAILAVFSHECVKSVS